MLLLELVKQMRKHHVQMLDVIQLEKGIVYLEVPLVLGHHALKLTVCLVSHVTGKCQALVNNDQDLTCS